jgi:hypothetical protein
MLELERVTTEYVANQDRISLTANEKSGGTARLWLTRRIADRLIPALLKAVQPRHEDPVYVEVLDEIAQHRAEQRQERQPPVKVVQPDREWLVDRIDLKMATAGTRVVFVSAEDERAQLTFNVELLRQWLGILRRLYSQAEWSTDIWPDSLSSPQAPKKPPTVLH